MKGRQKNYLEAMKEISCRKTSLDSKCMVNTEVTWADKFKAKLLCVLFLLPSRDILQKRFRRAIRHANSVKMFLEKLAKSSLNRCVLSGFLATDRTNSCVI